MSDDMDPMAEIRASFFIECEELMEALQDGLQTLEDGASDSETINIVFRAVHSIKGGAGAFGLELLVHFAHRYETALDEVRGDRLEVTDDAMKLFFQAADHLSDLIRVSRDDGEFPEERSADLLTQLDALIGEEEAEEEAEIDFQHAGMMMNLDLGDGGLPSLDLPDVGAEETPSTDDDGASFEVFFKPNAELYDTGNEPFQILRSLQELGTCSVELVADELPELADLSAEKPFIAWKVQIETDADEAELHSVFEFVEGLCVLDVKALSNASPSVPVTEEIPPPPPTLPDDEKEEVAVVPAAETPTPDVQEAPAPKPEPKPKPKAPAKKSAEPSKQQAAAKSVVRVDLDRIERLVNLVGELVINQAMLSQSLEQAGLSPHSDAMNGLEEFQRLTRDIQDSVMMIRAQPVKSLFQRMSRIVREASAAVKKDVRLITEGENTEVDKTVIERLADPLTHMIRNAVDHGLEDTETRKASGKPEQGVVRLTASHKSGRVIIDISDDGGGINRERVLAIAISKGLVPEDASLTDSEIDNLLFLPGFSTASECRIYPGAASGWMLSVQPFKHSVGGLQSILKAVSAQRFQFPSL